MNIRRNASLCQKLQGFDRLTLPKKKRTLWSLNGFWVQLLLMGIQQELQPLPKCLQLRVRLPTWLDFRCLRDIPNGGQKSPLAKA